MSTWRPPEKRDNNYLLFHNLYLVRVNELAIRSIEHVKDFGVLVSGRKEFDRSIENTEERAKNLAYDIAKMEAKYA
jgi:hypothetical protein